MAKAAWAESDVWSDKPVDVYASPGVFSGHGLLTSAESVVESLWRRCENELLQIRKLNDDWDGLGAEHPQPEVVDSVLELVSQFRKESQVPPPIRIVASPAGTVVLEWQLPSVRLEVEITKPYQAECMLEEQGKPIQHWEQSWLPPKSRKSGQVLIGGTSVPITESNAPRVQAA